MRTFIYAHLRHLARQQRRHTPPQRSLMSPLFLRLHTLPGRLSAEQLPFIWERGSPHERKWSCCWAVPAEARDPSRPRHGYQPHAQQRSGCCCALLRSWQEAAEADRRRRHQGPSEAERAAAWEAEKAEAKLAKVLRAPCWPHRRSAFCEWSFPT